MTTEARDLLSGVSQDDFKRQVSQIVHWWFTGIFIMSPRAPPHWRSSDSTPASGVIPDVPLASPAPRPPRPQPGTPTPRQSLGSRASSARQPSRVSLQPPTPLPTVPPPRAHAPSPAASRATPELPRAPAAERHTPAAPPGARPPLGRPLSAGSNATEGLRPPSAATEAAWLGAGGAPFRAPKGRREFKTMLLNAMPAPINLTPPPAAPRPQSSKGLGR